MGVFLPVVQFLAFNGFRDRAEFPGDAPLKVEFLLSLLAQFPFGNKFGHIITPFAWREKLYHKGRMTTSVTIVFRFIMAVSEMQFNNQKT